MDLSYYAKTDSLYISVAKGISADCVEIFEGVMLDFDATGKLVGIDIDRVGSLPLELEIPDHLPRKS